MLLQLHLRLLRLFQLPPLPPLRHPHLTATMTRKITRMRSLPLPASPTTTTGTAHPVSQSQPLLLRRPSLPPDLPLLAVLAHRGPPARLPPSSPAPDLLLAQTSTASWPLFWGLLVLSSCKSRQWEFAHCDVPMARSPYDIAARPLNAAESPSLSFPAHLGPLKASLCNQGKEMQNHNHRAGVNGGAFQMSPKVYL